MSLNNNIWFIPKYWRQQDKEPLMFEFYRINTCGEIISLLSRKRMKSSVNRGYKYVSLYHPKTFEPKNKKPKKSKKYRIHKLVACTFLPNTDRYIYNVVDHKDRDRGNNCVYNLEWVTYSENTRRAFNEIQEENNIKIVEIPKNQLSLFEDEKE
jgi:hypothetical protein